MNKAIPRIKIELEGKELQAFYAVSAEFCECGKASRIGMTMNRKEKKLFKFNDADFLCVYSAILRSLNSSRYPTKSGNEYLALSGIKKYFETEYMTQRNSEIPC